MANLFYARFWGRQDVYAKRSEKKSTGEAGYYTQCHNRWEDICPKMRHEKMNCKDCPYQAYKQLTIKDIRAHLQGRSYNGSDVIGVYPLLKSGTCRFLVFDFNNHEKGAEKKDFANTNETWMEEIEAMRTICGLNGIDPLVERSRSGRGAHLWIFFDKPIPASLARRFGFALLEKGAEQVNLKSFKYYDRMLPAQDTLPEGGLGNLIALPLQGQALRKGNSAFIDSNWNAYPNQWDVLWSKPRLSVEFIETKIKEWAASDITEAADDNGNAEEREQPWKKEKPFRREDVNGKFSLVLSNGIYIDSPNLKAALQNQIRRLAAIRNPIFYKNAAIGMSNFATAQWIYFGKDHLSGYIEIPRGLYNRLIEKIKEADIPFEISDERQCGRHINVTFAGELRQEQKPALEEMMKYDNGILQAATAFGKTVVCSAMIAEKKVNTLIILESSALLEQWKDALEKFLDIDEKLPEYKTKTGRIRVRKSLIGKLQGAHDSMTGIVDIAMAGSLCKKGEWHPLLDQYGMVIVDECHHAASDTIAEVLQKVTAKYVYGVTATPKRSDGLEKINYMLLGPIRYSYSAKEKVKAQGIPHLVYPRFTRTVLPRGVTAEELIMATPVSFRSVVEQYAGRLNRNYAGKKDVIVFDYVDSHIPMFERMYGKRLKAYKQIGYEICCGLDREKQEANAIFDSENYKEVFRRDLLEAEQRIIISSNVISAKKVYEIINILKEKQALGIEVTIVTWEPDDYGFGDAAFWMQLHEDMRQAGFFIKTVEDSCENFAVIDQEIIWYGNIHLLGKEKVEDNIMRVKDKKIAAELLELAFK